MARKPLLVLSSLLLAFAGSDARAQGAPWFLGTCPPGAEQKALQVERKIRETRPGAPNHVQHPYPRTPERVFQDFVSQFQESWSQRSKEDTPAPERSLLSLLDRGAVRYEALKIAEWRAQRCSRMFGKKDSLWLLRLFDKAQGNEVARVTLRDSGLMATLDFPQEPGQEMRLADGHRLEPFEQAAKAALEAGLPAKDFQYVAVAGPGLMCYESMPCIAFRHGGRAFLYRSGKLFELLHDRIRFSNRKFVHEGPERADILAKLKPGDHVVSLGGDDMTIARPIKAGS